MVGPSTECQIRLFRDSLTTPWGFRLQGGKDFKLPLSVQRVFVGSPADGELQRGDVIVAINNYDATNLTHKQAMDIIKDGGGALSLRLRRSLESHQPASQPSAVPPAHTFNMETPQYFRSRPMDAPGPKPFRPSAAPQFGVDYSRGMLPAPNIQPAPRFGGKDPTMLNRVQQSLTNALWSPSQDDENYETPSVNQLKNVFAANEQATRAMPGRPQPHRTVNPQPHRTINPQPAWKKQDNYTGAPAPVDPGWTSPWTPSGSAPAQYQPLPFNRPAPVNRPEPARQAWIGSLKSSGGPKPWEMKEPQQQPYQDVGGVVPVHQPRVQHFHHGPGGDVTYEQHSQGDPGSDTAQIKHLQYNTPIGLYSKENVQDVLEGQTHGKPGHGTMQVTSTGPGGQKVFDPKSSDVLRMIQEEEGHRRPPGHGLLSQQSARNVGPDQSQQMHYGGYVDPNRQGPAMARLNQQFSGPEARQMQTPAANAHYSVPEAVPTDHGISDF